ncbi:hypothetical protein EJ05DRAFT_509310 [Pseudovirgaria hyperparasitica]|uniref:Ankyrin n=1 Tax=Pseudovirgaria hyperparasitica TaxID=470096 RepID=A0A6A6WDE2_9PEZI|nr:uncharacterized protein EJ05DRAFT_509310 [Pseudovirgaria hyperparasitica]KAF2759577.1 hypothetical protein EJ05DRAFT_509310 [Pseudovirgaria hyperparasitica]
MPSLFLPDEVLMQILVESVRIRTIKRALRLRLVSRRFSRMTCEAIFESGLIEMGGLQGPSYYTGTRYTRIHYSYTSTDFLQRYLVYKCTRLHDKSPQFFWAIRQVVEYIWRYRHPDSPLDRQNMELLLSRIAFLSVRGRHFDRHLRCLVEDEEPRGPIQDPSKDMNYMLLSAAAYIGDPELVEKLLTEDEKRPRLERLCYSSSVDNCFDFLTPYQAAAHAGHVNIIKALEPRVRVGRKSFSIARYAAEAGHAHIIDLAFPPNVPLTGPSRIDTSQVLHAACKALSNLSSERLFIIYHQKWTRLLARLRSGAHRINNSWAYDELEFRASAGSLGILRYLLTFGIQCNPSEHSSKTMSLDWCLVREYSGILDHTHLSRLAVLAAQSGHINVVSLLLDLGADANKAIPAACGSGSISLVGFLIDSFDKPPCRESMQEGFLSAVACEDHAMIHYLLDRGLELDHKSRTLALDIAKKEGLESMVHLIEQI